MSRKHYHEYKKFNFDIIVSTGIMMLTVLGTTVGLFLHIDSKTDANLLAMRQSTDSKLEAIHQEMKDFHGRLCAIEERNKGKY